MPALFCHKDTTWEIFASLWHFCYAIRNAKTSPPMVAEYMDWSGPMVAEDSPGCCAVAGWEKAGPGQVRTPVMLW